LQLSILYNFLFQLHSENPNDLEWACSSLAHIFLEEPLAAIQPLKDSNSLQRLVQLTGDAELSVVTAAAGALRNLTLAVPDELGQQIVDAILGFNGIAPLIHHLENVCVFRSHCPTWSLHVLNREILSLIYRLPFPEMMRRPKLRHAMQCCVR
jgi:hypothetical protein